MMLAACAAGPVLGGIVAGPVLGGIVAEEYGIRTAILLLLAAISALSLFSFLMPAPDARSEPRRLPAESIAERAEGPYPPLAAGLLLADRREPTPDSAVLVAPL